MNPVVFTSNYYKPENLYPFSLTTDVKDMPCGMLTNRKRWELIVEQELPALEGCSWRIPGGLLPSEAIVASLKKAAVGDWLQLTDGEQVWRVGVQTVAEDFHALPFGTLSAGEFAMLEYGWNLFEWNQSMLRFDFKLLTGGRKSEQLPAAAMVTSPENVFIEAGAEICYAFINAEEGPVYIASGALIMEGACLRGPLFIGPGSVIKMGAKLYGGTSIGEKCTVGGEIKNANIFPFSNKAHDGYLGDAVIGKWCNLGAGTSNSNLKNTAGNISVNLPSGTFRAGRKCGVLMGDYSRTAINTSLNSGTVIGVGANVFGAGLTPKFIPSFSWGGTGAGKETYRLEDLITHLKRWAQTKDRVLSKEEIDLIKNIYKQTNKEV